MSTHSVVQGFLKGFCLYTGLILVSKRKWPPKVPDIRRALALGGFSACFRYARSLNGFNLQNSGVAATAVALVLDPSLTNSHIVSWLVCRTLKHALPTVPYGPTAAMCLCSAQLVTAWFLNPQFLEPAYLRFFNHQGSMSLSTLAQFRSATRRKNITSVAQLLLSHPSACILQSVPYVLLKLFLRALARACRLYVSFFALYEAYMLFNRYFAARQRKKTLKHTTVQYTLHAMKRFFSNVSRSSMFLASYTLIGWVMILLKDSTALRINTTDSALKSYTWMYSIMWLPGMATLFEPASRRADLAAYCATYALDSLCRPIQRYTNDLVRYIFGALMLCVTVHALLCVYNPDEENEKEKENTTHCENSSSTALVQRDAFLRMLF